MPLAHESAFLKAIESERKRDAFVEAGKKAQDLFDLLAQMRDRHQREKGARGTCCEIPMAVFGGAIWTVKVPWNEALLRVEAEAYAAKKKAEIAAEVIWGKAPKEKKRNRLRRILKSIMSTDGPVGDDGECPKCKGEGWIVTRIDSETCTRCKGKGWIEEGE